MEKVQQQEKTRQKEAFMTLFFARSFSKKSHLLSTGRHKKQKENDAQKTTTSDIHSIHIYYAFILPLLPVAYVFSVACQTLNLLKRERLASYRKKALFKFSVFENATLRKTKKDGVGSANIIGMHFRDVLNLHCVIKIKKNPVWYMEILVKDT